MPEEDPEILEKALEAYQQSRTASRKRPTKVQNPGRRLITPLEAGSPRVVGFTIEDSTPPGESSNAPPNEKSMPVESSNAPPNKGETPGESSNAPPNKDSTPPGETSDAPANDLQGTKGGSGVAEDIGDGSKVSRGDSNVERERGA